MKGNKLSASPLLLAWIILGVGIGMIWQTRTASSQVSQVGGTSTMEIESPATGRVIFHPALVKAMAEAGENEYLPVILEWDRSPEVYLVRQDGADRVENRANLVASLQQETLEKTAPVVLRLETGREMGQVQAYRVFWAAPAISIKATPDFIKSLGAWDLVRQVRLDLPVSIEKVEFDQVERGAPDFPLWNLQMVNALTASSTFQLDGTGVVVANFDTGVDWLHPALQKQYRGYRPSGLPIHYGNWHVSTDETAYYPVDGIGHGTHTMGTMVGSDGIIQTGVAPKASWISVKMFTNDGVAYESWILDAFEWIVAPEGNPALAPDVLNHSWNIVGSLNEALRQAVITVRSAGIFQSFAAGNSGPGQGTVFAPAAFPEAFSVGALDQFQKVARFSSRGPSFWGNSKPEISAPGVQIYSTFPGGGYAYANGTSMAAPHVAGAAALVLQGSPGLSPGKVEEILYKTASPLGEQVPDNDTGWGLLNAYLATSRAVASGQVSVQVSRAGGGVVRQPVLKFTPFDSALVIPVQGDDNGMAQVSLRTGFYTLEVNAFGFEPATLPSVQVNTGNITHLAITLSQQPLGTFFGMVKDTMSGIPLCARISVIGTSVSATTDCNTGAFSLALPAGSWSMQVFARGHKITTLLVNITAGQGTYQEIFLQPVPEILLVDSGAWYYESQVSYYTALLDSLGYPYDLWRVNLLDTPNLAFDIPTLDTLSLYDLVLWSAPWDSPGYTGASGALYAYLDQGGKLLVSGQDVVYWDGGGYYLVDPAPFIAHFGASFQGERTSSSLAGWPGSAFEQLVLAVNPEDSAKNQVMMDYLQIENPVTTRPAFQMATAETAGIFVESCSPHKAILLGAGIEGLGPETARQDLMQSLLAWFDTPAPAHGLVRGLVTPVTVVQPGERVTVPFAVINTGTATDTVVVEWETGDWDFTILDAAGQPVLPGQALPLPSCAWVNFSAVAEAPLDAQRGTAISPRIVFTSQADPGTQAEIEFVLKTPGYVLVLDDGRFQNYGDWYTAILDRLSIPHDLLSTGGDAASFAVQIGQYPILIWTTGRDWYAPLTEAEKKILGEYLDRGGRVLVSSQDISDYYFDPEYADFLWHYFGIKYVILGTDTHRFVPTEQNSLWPMPAGPVSLEYAYQNRSDGLVAETWGIPLFEDIGLNTIGVAQQGDPWRTIFYPFPLEALLDEASSQIIGSSILWLSPLAGSHLVLPRTARPGETLPLAFVLHADCLTATVVTATVTYPELVVPVSGTISGDWEWVPGENQFSWQGSITGAITHTFGTDFVLPGFLQEGDGAVFTLTLQTGDGFQIVLTDTTWLLQPWVEVVMDAPSLVEQGVFIPYTITLINRGVVTASVSLTQPLPYGYQIAVPPAPLPESNLEIGPGGWYWYGELAPGQGLVFEFSLSRKEQLSRPVYSVVNWVSVYDGVRARMDGTLTRLLQRHYLPYVIR